MRLNNIGKIFLVGDLHLGIRNNSVEWAEIQKQFLLETLPNSAKEQGFDPEKDILILEGDIFHSRESINVRIQNDSMEIFAALAKFFKRGVYIILGNHDVYYKDSNAVNSVRHLSHIAPNIHVFENPEHLVINSCYNWLLLPWVEDVKTLGNYVGDYSDICERIVCHADIKGLRFNRWTEVEHGLEITALSKYTRVYSGHIHHRQEKGNILYTGTPYQMDRGDRGNTKGYYIIDLNDNKLTETFIENRDSPVYVKYDICELLDMNEDQLSTLLTNNFVDVMIEINLSNKIPINQFLQALSQVKYRKIEFFTYSNNTIDEGQPVVNFDMTGEDKFNVVEIFKTYLNSKQYSNGLKKDLISKFFEIQKRAKDESDYA